MTDTEDVSAASSAAEEEKEDDDKSSAAKDDASAAEDDDKDKSEKEDKSDKEDEDGDDEKSEKEDEEEEKSRPATATSQRPKTAKSTLSRVGSAKSQKSVAWSTADSEAALVGEEAPDAPNPDAPEKSLGEKAKASVRWFLEIFSGMWSSREMLLDNSDKQLFVKITLRELIVYCFFLSVVMFQTFVQYGSIYYIYTDMLRGLFAKQLDVTNMGLFWQFAENDLIEGLYWETWYNKGWKKAEINCPDGTLAKQPCKVPPSDRNVMYENRLLGLPRLRQLKVTNNSCDIHIDFQKAIKVCFSPYAETKEDKAPYIPAYRNVTNDKAWVYNADTGAASHWGEISTYSGAGYIQDLHYLKDMSKEIISELKRGLWITQGTRFIGIDFTVYNANINLFLVGKLVFEFPATGGVIPSQSFTAVRLIKYINTIDYVLMGCEIIFILFIFYYMVEEAIEMKVHKMNYFRNRWNWLDIAVIGTSCAQIILNVSLNFSIGPKLDSLIAQPFEHADFSTLAANSRILVTLAALNVMVAWIKLFKYLSFNSTMTQLSETLSRAAKDLSGFSIMFSIIFFAFVQLGYLLFGTQVQDFRSLTDTLFTLFRMILGDFNFRDIERADTFLGPVYFLSYIFFVFFVLLNMFLAIINDTYGVVKADLKTRKPDFQMGDFFMTGVNNCKGAMGIHDRGLDVENAIKMAAEDDGFVTYDEIRENLRKARFSDVEIDIFFHHFQNDPQISQIILDEEEVKEKEMEREERRQSMMGDLSNDGFGSDDEPAQRPKSGREARLMRSARIKSAAAMKDAEEPVDDDEFYKLVGQVDKMEVSIAPLAQRIDIILAKLGADETLEEQQKPKKLTKANMENMFDQILQSDAAEGEEEEDDGNRAADSKDDVGAGLFD